MFTYHKRLSKISGAPIYPNFFTNMVVYGITLELPRWGQK